MKLAIMQPYFFPYLGYWQLLNYVDRFVIYDDVSYIKGGWINRNRIIVNGEPCYITIPLIRASPNRRICDIYIDQSQPWRRKMICKLEASYQKSPYFSEIFPVIRNAVLSESGVLSEFLLDAIKAVSSLIGVDTEIVDTSRKYKNGAMTGQHRVLDICREESTDVYINSAGGQSLYSRDLFESSGMKLQFLVSTPVFYEQRSQDHIANLSIIDVLMGAGIDRTSQFLREFKLVGGDS